MINSKKSVVYLYTNEKHTEKEISETRHFSITSNNIKYLNVTLTKQVKNLYVKNLKPLKKEIKEAIKRQKDLLCS